MKGPTIAAMNSDGCRSTGSPFLTVFLDPLVKMAHLCCFIIFFNSIARAY